MANFIGNYNINVKFGLNDISLDSSNMRQFFIIQDMNKYLPEFDIGMTDGQGLFTHIVPSDKLLSRIHIQVARDTKVEDAYYNDFDFTVYRRKPTGDFTPGNDYNIVGLQTTDALFAPSQSRSFSGMVSDSMVALGKELGCTQFEISDNLKYSRTLVQANWSDAEFIDWLKSFLQGKDSESAYQIFVKRVRGKSVFVCRTLKDLFSQPIKCKFIVHKDAVNEYYPVFQYSIFDNYKLLGASGSKRQQYHYFDYFNSQFVTNQIQATDMYSLSDHFMIDNDDTTDSDSIDTLGRNTESGEDYEYFVRGKYYNKLNNLIKMEILTYGIINLAPGDLVDVMFPTGQDAGTMHSYQYNGLYLIEKIIHSFTGTHRSRILLTRSGINTDLKNTLLKSINHRQ